MARGVAFEFKGKSDDPRWRRTWTWCMTLGSLLIPLLLGVGLGDLLVGLPINSSHDFTGNFFDLLTPYGLWTGVTLLGLCLLHGATFLKLRTADQLRERARAARAAARLGGDRAGRRLRDLDAQRRRRHRRARPGRGPRGDRRRSSPRAWRSATTTAGRSPPRRRDRGDGRLDLHRPLPQRDGLEHQRGLQPHRQQRRLGPLRADGHDDRRGRSSCRSSCSTRAGPSGVSGLGCWRRRTRNPDSKAPPRVPAAAPRTGLRPRRL